MAWTDIVNGSIDQDSPITQPLMTAIRDNIIFASQYGWQPYDMAQPGDGADGLLYDHSVQGTVAAVVTDNFEDGFEYRMIYDGISPTGSVVTLRVSVYGQTSASYATPTDISASMGPSDVTSGRVDFANPRLALTFHSGTTDVFSPAQKILKAKLHFSGGNIDAGKVWVYRRRFG